MQRVNMSKGGDDCLSDKTPTPEESDSNKSFVKKVKSRVSGFFPTSISKWFGTSESQVRQRDDSDEDEEFFDIQPPSKRIKPSVSSSRNCFTPTTDQVNHAEKKIVGSIFPEPVAGPSGVQARKTFTPTRCAKYRRLSVSQDVFNGDKYSDSGESTSGYSSMPKIGSKELLAETSEVKTMQTPVNVNATKFSLNTSSSTNDRSLFNEKSLSPQQANSSLSSRQPSFNASVFGSPNFVDRTISSKRIMNSPFYNGRTIYGGASAYGRHLGQSSLDPSKLPLRNIVQIKPVNDKVLKDNAALSKTARRILDTLEQYTTPIAEAKKIPNPSLRRPLKTIGASPYAIREPRVPSNKELQVPTVPDLLKMKLKERLQDSTVSVRQIATSSKSSLNTEEYTIRAPDESVPKHTNKMKAKVTSVRQKAPVQNELAPEVKLPDIQLPISTLPKFDFSLSAPPSSKKPSKSETTFSLTTTTLKTVTKTSPSKEEIKTTCTKEETLKTETSKAENDQVVSRKTENSRTETDSSQKTLITEYKFAEPLVLAENIKSVKAINNFIFSEPLSKKQQGKSALEMADAPKNFKLPPIESKRTQPPKTDVNKETASNVLTWECPVCLIRNISGDTKCKACNASQFHGGKKEKPKVPRGPPKTAGKSNFGGEFKLTADKWECATCLVRNNITDGKCVACTSPRVSATTKTTTTATASGFGDKFKPPSNSWECTVCMIRNKNELAKCVACESPRSKTETKLPDFGSSFKKKEGEWECDSCMVQNSPDLNKCQCCEAPKPGATATLNLPKEKNTLSTFNFGIDKSSVTNTHGFSLLAKTSENGPAAVSIFGQNSTVAAAMSAAPPMTFTFGIKPVQDQPAKTTEDSSPKVHNDKCEEVSAKPTGFVFGTNASTSAANNFMFKEPLPVTKINPAIAENATKSADKTDKPVSLNGDINKNESVFKSASSSMPQLNSSIQTVVNSTVGKDSAPNLFAFGAKPQAEPQTQQEQQQQQQEQPPQTLFGGNTNNDSQSTALFKFMPAENKTAVNDKPLFGSPFTSGNSVFGQTNPPAFGAATPSAVGAFGVQPKPFAFGSTPNTNNQSGSTPKTFSFGQQQNAAAALPEVNLFSFSGAGNSAAPTPNIFNPPPSNVNVNAVQPGDAGGFKFNSAPFGSLPQPAQNGAFNFGSNVNNAPKAGFSFGAPAAVQPTVAPPANTSGVFSFGAPSNLPPKGSGGFNFGTSDVKPSFNFTSGAPPPTFSATSSTDKPRLIRRAVRRTQR